MKLQYLRNVTTLKQFTEKCTDCRMCINVCPHNVFEEKEKKVRIAQKDNCMECGACMKNCAYGALFVKSGVGCASAVIYGKLKKTEPVCSCSKNESSCC